MNVPRRIKTRTRAAVSALVLVAALSAGCQAGAETEAGTSQATPGGEAHAHHSHADADPRAGRLAWPAVPGRPTVLYLPDAGETDTVSTARLARLRNAGFGLFVARASAVGARLETVANLAEQAWNQLQCTGHLVAEDVAVWGHGLGALVATELSVGVRPRSVILESPVTEADAWPRLRALLGPLAGSLPKPVSMTDMLPHIRTRILFLHVPDDSRVPLPDVQALLAVTKYEVGLLRLDPEQTSPLAKQAHRERISRLLAAPRLAQRRPHDHPPGHHHVGH